MSTTDLVADLAKKSGLVWVTYAGRDHAVWHEWIGDAVCVVSGGAEQSLPGIADQQTVTLSLRSKSTRALAARVEARVEVVAPGSEHWQSVTSTLRSGRLNLTGSAWHQQQLEGPGTRTAGDMRLEYRRDTGTVFIGAQVAMDRGRDGKDRDSRLLTLGGSQILFGGDLTVSGQTQFAPGGDKDSVDFPIRHQLTAAYRITPGIRLIGGSVRVDGVERPIAEVLNDPALAPLLSDEGPIKQAKIRIR